MAKKKFSQEEIALLKENPYTVSVNEDTIRFTVAFKIAFMKLYDQAVPVREILPKLGYPLEIIGKARLNGISQKIRNEAKSPMGLREIGDKRNLEDLPETETAELSDRQMINRLQCEVAYLRQEMEFIKKISDVDNTGKRKN